MLFCFSSQQAKEEEHVYLVDEADELEVEDSQEAHDNLINEDLLGTGNGGVAAVVKNLESALSTRRSNHRRTNSFDDLHSGPIKLPLPTSTATTAGTLRSFRKSHASSASLGATTGAALAAATAAAAANGKFVDPSVAVAAVAAAAAAAAAAADQQQFGGSHTQHQQSVSTGNGISRTFGKLGPFLRRNRSSKGTEHLQREALRKSNETAAGLGIDQSQRYIKLPTSSAVTSGAGTGCSPASSPTTASAKSSSSLSSTRSTPQSHSKCSSLTKSATSVAIAASCDSQQQQQQQQKQQQSPSVTSCELSLATGLHSACRSDPTAHRVFHRQRHHSPASSSSSSSSSVSSSTSSPPAPTLVPRSANNPPPRPKTSKPSRGGGSSNDTIATVVSSTAATANNNTTATTTTTTTANTSSCSRNSSLPARPSSTVAGVLSASAAVSLDQLLSGLTAVNIFSPICSQLSSTATNSATMTTAMLTSSVPSSSDSTTSMATTTTSGHAQCTGSGGSSSGQQSQQQQQQQQQSQQSQQQQQQQSTSSSSSSSSNHHHHQHQQFINKPPRGWLHPDHKLSDSVGVTYAVRYIGCLGVNTSMKSLDFDTRSLIAKECINRVCEAAGLKTADKKRRTEKRIARMLADAPNMENAGVDVNLSITSAHLNLIVAESGEHLAKHEMPNISFASGGDTDTLDFAAYVAKDNRFGRACFVLECGGGRAQDVITTIGQAFELRFKEFLKRTPRALTDRLDGTHFNGSGSALAAHSQAPPPRADDREYYNDLPGKIPPDIVPALPASAAPASVPHAAPRKKNGLLDQVNLIDLTDDHQTVAVNGTSGDANTVTASQLKTPLAHGPQYVNCTMAPQEEPKDSFDMQPFTSALADDVNVAATTTTATTTSTSTSKGRSQPVGAPAGSVSIAEVEYVANCELDKEDWFHGPIPRKQSEELVIRDGDFLVRESKGSSGSGEQYVLTGMQSGTHKHLLLVDPEGVVRTKDKTFESVSHLINYHRNNGLPIISSESALILKNPIVAPKLSTLKTN